MKINEITNKQLDEGVLDNLKAGFKGIGQGAQTGQGVLGKIGGAIKGAGAGYQAQRAVGQQQTVNKQTLFKTQQAYNAWAAQIKAAGQEPTAEQATAWFKQMFGTDPTTPLSGTNPAQIQQWLTKEIPAYMAKKATGGDTATTGQPAQSAAPIGQTAQPTGGQTAQPNPPADAAPLPDISKLTREQLLQLRQQLQAA
jgi:hypothetical protein